MIQISTLKIKVKSAALEPFAASTLQPHSQSFGQSFENELRKQQKYRVHITPLTDADAVLDLSKVLCRILTTIRKYSIGLAELLCKQTIKVSVSTLEFESVQTQHQIRWNLYAASTLLRTQTARGQFQPGQTREERIVESRNSKISGAKPQKLHHR